MKRYIVEKDGKQIEVVDLSKTSTKEDIKVRTGSKKVKEINT